jgi:fibronectin-binding autotransporter adhesin
MRQSFIYHRKAMVGGLARILPLMLVSAVVLIRADAVHAQTWTGGASNFWSNPTNWSPNTVPNSSSANVSITGGTNNPVVIDFSPSIGNLTVGATNTLDMIGVYLYVAGTSVANSGQINVGSPGGAATLYADNGSPLTITGTGAITLGNANSYLDGYNGTNNIVLNQSTINGQGYIYNMSLSNLGTVNANVPGGKLYIYDAPTFNSGTLQATGGGTLEIYNSSVTSAGGTISTDNKSSVIINDSALNGSTLTSSGSAMIHGINGTSLNGVTITSGSTYSLDGSNSIFSNSNYLASGMTNNGKFLIGGTAGGATLYADSDNVTISGTGAVTLNNANAYIEGSRIANHTLVNQSAINGQGYIYSLTLINQGTIEANVPGGTLNVYIAPTTNNGVFRADPGATLSLVNSTLSNFESSGSAGTLTGGTYQIFSGTMNFYNGGFLNNITTNAATILLDGTDGAPKFVDQNQNSALAHFSINAPTGNFTIQNGVNLTTSPVGSGGFSNYGELTIGAKSSFTVGGSNDYLQNSGTTTLAAPSSVLSVGSGHSIIQTEGTIQGFGTIQGNLTNNGGVVLPGLLGTAGVLTVTGNYSQDSGPVVSHLSIQIGGPDALHGLAQLDVGGTATLTNGLLDLSLINGFTPFNGELFEILTSSGLSGMFLDNTIELGNFTLTVEYSPSGYANDVVLLAQVNSIPEPSSWLMLALGVAGAGAFAVVRSGKRRARAAQF